MGSAGTFLLISHGRDNTNQVSHRCGTAGGGELRYAIIFLVLSLRNKVFPCVVQQFAFHNELSLGGSSAMLAFISIPSLSNIPSRSGIILVKHLPWSFLTQLSRSLLSLGQFLVLESCCDNIIWVLRSNI
jgi:hypothetical protein